MFDQRRSWALLLLIAAAATWWHGDLAAAESSMAEPPLPIPYPTTMLLRAQAVHRELGLNADQRRATETALTAVELPLWKLRDTPAEERNPAARGWLQWLQVRLSTILTPRQLERLDQLVVQALGARAVFEPRVAAALGVSPSQRQRVQAAFAALTRNANRIPAAQAEAMQGILAALTERQRQVLVQLMGSPFDFTSVPHVACQAPELTGVTEWINTSPLTLEQLRGKVVAVHFYAFGCINCVRNLPHYNRWHEDFDGDEFIVLGIHRPETQTEHEVEKARRKASEAGMEYPIAIDNESHNWDAWVNRVWPSVYLIDKSGFVRYWWYGELNWQGSPGEKWMRQRITELLAEPAAPRSVVGTMDSSAHHGH